MGHDLRAAARGGISPMQLVMQADQTFAQPMRKKICCIILFNYQLFICSVLSLVISEIYDLFRALPLSAAVAAGRAAGAAGAAGRRGCR